VSLYSGESDLKFFNKSLYYLHVKTFIRSCSVVFKLILSKHLRHYNTFNVVSVDPVEDVEETVDAESEEVMRGNRFGFSGFLDHEELGKNGHRLQVDGERPKDLHH